MQEVFQKALSSSDLSEAVKRLAPGGRVQLAGVWGSSAALLAAAAGQLAEAPVLFVTRHLDDADELADDVEVFSGRTAELFPAWETDVAVDHVSDEVSAQRACLCDLLANLQAGKRASGNWPFIVAPIMALLQPVPSPSDLAAGRLTMTRGVELGVDALAEWLVSNGYEHVEQVDQQGEFAHRGGIVDVFSPGASQAVRVEFFGDVIDSIRQVDLDTSRSTDEIDAVDLMALTVSRAHQGQTACLLDYLPPKTVICVHEPADVTELAMQIYDRVGPDAERGADAPVLAALLDPDDVFRGMQRFARLTMHSFRPKSGQKAINLDVRSLERLSGNTSESLAGLGNLAKSADVWVYCENPAEQKRFGELLAEGDIDGGDRIRTAIGHVRSGFHWPGEGLVVVGHHEVFHRYARRRRVRRVRTGRPIEALSDLHAGDLVVHVGHGIARFAGLKMLERDGRREEYLALRFAGNAVLHVPASQINLVQKYIGSRGARPTLSRIGGKGWERQKERVSEAVRDLAAEMLRVQAMRQATEGVSYQSETPWQRQFADEFIYSETEDQLVTMEDIDADMIAGQPMDRLVCGDVGFGKTELAMRAAFKVVEGGKQVAVLVPTTVLADQHYRTFTERFADYPVVVDVISRFRTAREQAGVVKATAGGQVDILIGTHRLLSADVRFADLGLAIIDEEQRFGVEHKEHLKRMRATVDVMTMTATPIPRTLHMALLGLRDISSLASPPLDRRAIHTEVCQYDERLIRTAIIRELNRDGQTFFLHNRVMDIESIADTIRQLVPDARIAVGHGQMLEGELEETMLQFVRREIDVLVCTTIIESGLDIPTANTIIIHEADRFGLSELHQLRGRVGRYRHRAFCYLLLPQRRSLSAVAAKRLKAIEEFSDLGAGFQIAMRDLEIRGAGNILGREQSGHIAVVGYELYCQLLEGAVSDLQGKPVERGPDVHVELGIDAYIPHTYVPSDRQRMELYRRLSRCTGATELDQMRADMADAFGAVPEAVGTLLELVEVRALAGAAGVVSIIRDDPDIVFSVRDFKLAEPIFEGAVGTARLPDEHTVHWRLPPAARDMPTLLRVLLKRLRQAHEKL
ncbi:MAG: transcription-repair coupling factor [Planctomycetota bacterium]